MSITKKLSDSELRLISNNIQNLNEALATLSAREGSDWDTLKTNEARQFLASFYKEVSSFLMKDNTQAAKKLAAVYDALAEFVVEDETVSLYSKGASD